MLWKTHACPRYFGLSGSRQGYNLDEDIAAEEVKYRWKTVIKDQETSQNMTDFLHFCVTEMSTWQNVTTFWLRSTFYWPTFVVPFRQFTEHNLEFHKNHHNSHKVWRHLANLSPYDVADEHNAGNSIHIHIRNNTTPAPCSRTPPALLPRSCARHYIPAGCACANSHSTNEEPVRSGARPVSRAWK